MEDIPYTPPVDLNPDELKNFINSHKESQYLLIDVRQPGEYQLGHLPGAKLMPLMELESKLFNLPADQDLVPDNQPADRLPAAVVQQLL